MIDPPDGGEHRHPHHTLDDITSKRSRRMHSNKKLLAYQYADVTSTVRQSANHWKPTDFPASFPGRMGVTRHTLIGIVGLP